MDARKRTSEATKRRGDTRECQPPSGCQPAATSHRGYRHPHGKTISIAVVKHRATDPARRARWPHAAGQDRYAGPRNRRTASPILVIGNTGDPATSYQDSVAMSRDLARARLLTVDGFGHTEFANPSTCATSDEIRYLTAGALPPAGTVCKQNGTPFPMASE
jgi:hypothetical protein